MPRGILHKDGSLCDEDKREVDSGSCVILDLKKMVVYRLAKWTDAHDYYLLMSKKPKLYDIVGDNFYNIIVLNYKPRILPADYVHVTSENIQEYLPVEYNHQPTDAQALNLADCNLSDCNLSDCNLATTSIASAPAQN